MNTEKTKTFMNACLHYFGKKPGQSTKDFGDEVKALTDDDRAEIKTGLEAEGYTILPGGHVPAKVKLAEPVSA